MNQQLWRATEKLLRCRCSGCRVLFVVVNAILQPQKTTTCSFEYTTVQGARTSIFRPGFVPSDPGDISAVGKSFWFWLLLRIPAWQIWSQETWQGPTSLYRESDSWTWIYRIKWTSWSQTQRSIWLCVTQLQHNITNRNWNGKTKHPHSASRSHLQSQHTPRRTSSFIILVHLCFDLCHHYRGLCFCTPAFTTCSRKVFGWLLVADFTNFAKRGIQLILQHHFSPVWHV